MDRFRQQPCLSLLWPAAQLQGFCMLWSLGFRVPAWQATEGPSAGSPLLLCRTQRHSAKRPSLREHIEQKLLSYLHPHMSPLLGAFCFFQGDLKHVKGYFPRFLLRLCLVIMCQERSGLGTGFCSGRRARLWQRKRGRASGDSLEPTHAASQSCGKRINCPGKAPLLRSELIPF